MSTHHNNQQSNSDKKNSEECVLNCLESQKQPINEDEKYAVLMETSGEECESWYYCIRYKGNEKNLKHLQDQLETVDWYILDDLSTFDLDLEHFISEKTAKELTKLELNHHSFHRKFDGVLDRIDLKLRKKDKNDNKMVKVFDILGYGQIEDYIDQEDLDEEDLTDNPESSSESEDDSEDDTEDDTEDDSEDEDKDDDKDEKKNRKFKKIIPKNLHNIPRAVQIKRHNRKHNSDKE